MEASPIAKPSVAIHADGIVASMPALLSFKPVPSPGAAPVDGFTLSCPVEADATMTIKGRSVLNVNQWVGGGAMQ